MTTVRKIKEHSFDLKIAVPNIELNILLSELPIILDKLKKSNLNIEFRDIDFKADYACCVTQNIESYIDTNFLEKHKLIKLKTNIFNMFSYLIPTKFGNIRSKIYNKFSCFLNTSSLKNCVGDNIPKWINNTGKVLNKAINDKRTQSRGLSRLEFTILGLPSINEINEYINLMENMYLPKCNYTSISKQWKIIESHLKHTLVTYNCFTGKYVIARWICGNKINGIKSNPNNLNITSFINLLGNCSLSDLDIDIVMISPTITHIVDGKIISKLNIPFTFDKLINSNKYTDNINNKFIFENKYAILQLKRIGPNKKTYFLSGSSLKSIYKSNGIENMLDNIDHCNPSLITKQINSTRGINLIERNIKKIISNTISEININNLSHNKVIKCINIKNYNNQTVLITETNNIRSNISSLNDKFRLESIPFSFKLDGYTSNNNNSIPRLVFIKNKPFSDTPITKKISKSIKTLDVNKYYEVQNIWEYKGKIKNNLQFSLKGNESNVFSDNGQLLHLINEFKNAKKIYIKYEYTKHEKGQYNILKYSSYYEF